MKSIDIWLGLKVPALSLFLSLPVALISVADAQTLAKQTLPTDKSDRALVSHTLDPQTQTLTNIPRDITTTNFPKATAPNKDGIVTNVAQVNTPQINTPQVNTPVVLDSKVPIILQAIEQNRLRSQPRDLKSDTFNANKPAPKSTAQAQVTSVSQLEDVKPTDWAFTALQSLVERYGCIAGYPDRSYRGQRAMTRYEFAAGLNACLDKINEIISAGLADKVSKDDLATLKRLQEEFAAELATLRGRVDALEAKTAKLEAQQFSTTTVLGGEVIFGLSSGWGGGPPGLGQSNLVFTQLAQLQTVTSFSGKDRLRIVLQAGNFAGRGFAEQNALNTYTSLLAAQSDTANQFQLSQLNYRFPAFGDRVVFTIQPVGFSLSSVLSANSPYFDTGRGAISRLGQVSPVFRIGNLDAGVGFDWLISERFRLQFAYGVSNPSDPRANGGLFGSRDQAMGLQFLLLPTDNLLTGITLVSGYSSNARLNTFTGSFIADTSGLIDEPANIYALNGTLQWQITPKITFSTWGGLVATYAPSTQGFAASTNYMFALGFADLFGREGDLLAILFGQPPKLVNYDKYGVTTGLIDTATSSHFEVFYRYVVNRNISITPGFFLVTNPGNIANNNTIYVGTIRTTFRF
ncbi:Iron uptake porin [Tumidithrix helvetica PCC 7403]|uniref:iron uptake porin n=1 Tax=Tumidithrix helvetica TaxID=3457545 RepID=UPI003CBB0D31